MRNVGSLLAASVVVAMLASTSLAQPSESQSNGSGICPPSLQSLCGEDFDNAYMLTAYQQNADIAALARFGAGLVSNLDLQELSRKIVRERGDMNAKLSLQYSQFTACSIPATDSERARSIERSLNNCGCGGFDCQYAGTLIGMLAQSGDAAGLAAARSCRPELRDQARITARTSLNEALALQRWQQTGFTAYATQWQPLSEYCGVSRPTPCDGCTMFTP